LLRSLNSAAFIIDMNALQREDILTDALLAMDRCDAVTLEDIAHRLIRNNMAKIGQCSDDPIIAPAGILSSHADDKVSHLPPEPRPSRIRPVLRTIELLSDEPAVPGEDRIRFGDARHFFQRLSAEASADFC
jgi:hypothetical protein